MTNRKHLKPIFIAVALFAVGIFGFQNTDALSGLGTQRYPYRINTCDQLQQIESNLTASYALNGDIDCDGITFSPITNFQGHLDGRNFTIGNLSVNSTGNHTGNGALFQKLTGASIKNLKMTNLSLNVDGGEYVGGLAGFASATTIDHVFVAGTVQGDSTVGGLVGGTGQNSTLNATSFTGSFINSGGYTGGLVSMVGDTVISNSYVDADGVGGNSGGGLVARIFTDQSSNSSITNSYATGSYRDSNYRGGIASSVGAYSSGSDPVSISNVFSTTLVTFNGTTVSSMGGIVGQNETPGIPISMSNVIYDNTKSGGANSCVAGAANSGCSDVNGDSQFIDNSTNEPFNSGGNQLWDFDNVWQTTSGLPTLREATLDPLEGATSPSNPNFTSVTPGPDNIEANWVSPGDDYLGGEPIIAYHLAYSLAGQNSWTTIDLSPNTTSYNITGLTSGESYDVMITAENIQGSGSSGLQFNIHIFNPNISTCRDLQNISSNPGADYVLANDIDCSATAISDPEDPNYDNTLYHDGEGFIPIQDFTGTLSGEHDQGQKYTISNLTINRPESWDQGLFAQTYGAYIHDLNMTGVDVVGSMSVGGLISSANADTVVDNIEIGGTVQGAEGVSMVAGGVYGIDGYAPSFSNVSVTGSLLTLPGIDGEFFGGLAGYVGGDANGGNFNFSDIHSNITVSNSEEVVTNIGGIIGQIDIVETARVDITDSQSEGELYGANNNAGGVVGSYFGNRDGAFPEVHIDNVIATNLIQANSNAGGLVGEMNAGYGAKLFIDNSVFKTLDQELAYGIYVYESGGVGGLVGAAYQDSNGSIEVHTSYVDTGLGNNNGDAGGLFGHMEVVQYVTDSYANVYLLGGGNVGGIAGGSIGTTANNVYTTGVGYSTDDPVGGLFGSLVGGFVSNSFTSMYVDSESSTEATLIGSGIMSNLTMSNLWYDQYEASRSDCYYSSDTSQYVSDESCNAANFNEEGTPSDPNHFKGNSTNDPFAGHWDFTDVWGTTATEGYGYPVLRVNPQAEINDPVVYNITDCSQLQNMQRDLDGDFTLANDINCYETSGWNNDGDGAKGFEPVGTEAEPFTGTLNGFGHSINGLWINRQNENNVGIFGVTSGASIGNFDTGGEADIHGGSAVGQIVGTMFGGDLHNIKGQVFSVDGSSIAGGLVGTASCLNADEDLSLTNVRNYANTYIDDEIVGGIVGQITSSDSDCDVVLNRVKNYGLVGSSSYTTAVAGGLAGEVDVDAGNVTIQDSRNESFVIAETSAAGGLVGVVYHNSSAPLPQLIRNTSSGSTFARNDTAGGIVGYVDNGIYIFQNVVNGQVMGSSSIGGLVGVLYGNAATADISQSYATGNVSNGESEVGDTYGGLVGYGYDAIITDSFSSNNINVDGAADVGGIAGRYAGDIINSYSDGTIISGGPTGGIVGHYSGSSTDNPVGLAHDFSTAYLDGTPGQTAGIAGRAEYPSLLNYDYFDSGRTSGWSYCAYDTNGDLTTTPTCEPYNLEGTGPDQFLDNSTTPPFQMPPEDSSQVWDFDNVWTTKDNDHPELRWAYTRPVASITNCQELQAIRFAPDGEYTLNGPEGEIDCRDTHNWNGGDGFLPIGNYDTPFTGILHGNGNTILGLAISSEEDNVGMFGVTKDASIGDFILQTANDSAIVSPVTNTTVGAVVGEALDGTNIDGIQALTPVATWGSSVGGLVGEVACEIDGSSISITNSVSDGFINYRGTSEGNYGGLIGFIGSDGDCPVTVSESASFGTLHYGGSGSFGGEDVGGLVGYIYSGSAPVNITENYGSANITNAYGIAGGLIGAYYDNSDGNTGVPQIHITSNISDGNVITSDEGSRVGGLVGEAWGGEISDSTTSEAAITGGTSVGGLVGVLNGDNQSAQVARSYSENTVTSDNTAGGLVGEGTNTRIEDSYSKSLIHAPSGTAGGLVGIMSGDVVNSYAAATIASDTVASEIGGLVGRYNGTGTGQHDALLHNFSATIFDFEHGGVPNVGGIAGNFTDSDGYHLNTNYYDEDRAATNVCAWVSFGSPDTLSCDTRSYTTFQGNDSENPFVVDGDRNWDFNRIWRTTDGEFPELRQEGPGAVHSITSCLQLQAMQYDLSGHFTLANDINCHDEDTPNDSSIWNDGQGFLPVGNNDFPFTGTLDGQGHTIAGLYINSDSGEDAGLFSSLNGATVQNITFNYSLAGSSSSVAGMVAGSASDTSIYRIAVTNSVVGSNYEDGNPTGGIVGIIFGTPTNEIESTSTIRESFVTDSTVSAGNYVGGLAGVSVGTVLIDSYSDASINGNSQVGGLVGVNASAIVVSSYATGGITANDAMGGIAGNNDTGVVALSFAAVAMNPPENGTNIGGLVGAQNGGLFGSYFDQSVTGPYSCSNVLEECGDTAVNEDGTDGAHFFNNTTVPPFDAGSPFWNFEDVWQTREADYPILQWAEQAAPVYDITNCAELQNINTDLTGNYRLMNDIDCSSVNNFTPIGRGEGISFTGTFDGQGHSINNLFIVYDGNNVGLFGQTDGASLHDFTLHGYVDGQGSVGAIVGRVYGDTEINRVGSYSFVYGDDYYVGGLVGFSSDLITIEDSYNQGVVEGSRYMGGLLGYTEDEAEISRSYNSGDVSGMGDVGGIAGVIEYGTVDSNFNAGRVEAGNSHAAIVNTVGEVYFTNNYVDDDRSGVTNCIDNVGSEECHIVNTNEEPNDNYFFDNSTNSPFELEGEQNWNFDGTWLSHHGQFPTLGVRDSYTITNCSELAAINNDLSGYYTLANNIGPCSFTPLAQSDPFTGVLDGNGFTIDGLNLTGGYPKALFGFANNASVKDLNINDVSTSGAGCGGSLFGEADGFDIYNVHVFGDINTETSGGLVGCNYSTSGNHADIEKSTFTGSVTGIGASGGLIGQNVLSNGSTLTVKESSSFGSVWGMDSCGGLLGPIDYEWDGIHSRQGIFITNSWSDSNISCQGSTGGLVSEMLVNGLDLTISQSHFSGSINANNGDNVGGLMGVYNTDGHTPFLYITDSYVEANIENGGWYVGGLLGLLPESTSMYLRDSYYKGDVNMTGSRGGGLVGETQATYNRFEIANTYAAGSITSTNQDDIGVPWTGGLVGAMQNGGYISNSFAAMNVTTFNIDTFLAGGLVGDANLANTHFYNNYYNSDTGTGYCSYGDDDYIIDEQCHPVSLSEFPDIWKANDQDAPFSDGNDLIWNFGETWHIRANDYPSLSPAVDPEVQCNEVSTTTNSLHVACSFFSVDDTLYGPTTWEMRYSVLGSSDWITVDLDNQSYFDKTISGLQSNTEYRVQFRYTDDRGASEWLHIDATTNQANSEQSPEPTLENSTTNSVKTKKKSNPQVTTPSSPSSYETVVVPASSPDQKITLNDFTDYYGNGKQLTLEAGQVIYFMVGNEEHSATIKEVGTDYVVITLASKPHDVRLKLGQRGQYDVNEDGKSDIEVTLQALTGGVASLKFKQLGQKIQTPSSGHINTSLWWIIPVFIASGCAMIIVIRKRESTDA